MIYHVTADIDGITLPFPRERYEAWARERIRRLGNDITHFGYKLSSGSGIHVTAWLKNPISMDLVPIYQLAIGSDVKRECMNYFRFKYGVDINVLFQYKRANRIDWSVKVCGSERRFMGRICPGLLQLLELYKKELGLDLLQRLF
ncbi:MAG: hypothetical protein JZD41_07885 [Thermoproteus sp.]|nr:hypothetical protein [Thermoproteus sp.]